MAQKKYVSLAKLGTFLTNLKTIFAPISHKHKVSDLTDYAVDGALSPTSTNPVQNKVIKAELGAISSNIQTLEGTLTNHTHEIASVNKLQETLDGFNENKTQVKFVIYGDDD